MLDDRPVTAVLRGCFPGDELIRGTSEVVQVTRKTFQRLWIGKQKYHLNGAPYGHTGEWLRLPNRGEIEHLKQQKLLHAQSEQDKFRERFGKIAYDSALNLVNLTRYTPEQLLNKYGAERCKAAWKALTDEVGR